MAIEAVIGLGNPGDQYARTRHNAGFEVVDRVWSRLRGGSWKRENRSLVSRSRRGRPVVLAKPQTFMNRSGVAVASLTVGEGLAPDQVLVVVDDVDLPLGAVRLRKSGGPGTHNGLRDIVAAVGTGFPRLRVGVRGESVGTDLADYVLAPFDKEEEEAVEAMFDIAAEAVVTAVLKGVDAAMNRFNSVPSRGGDVTETDGGG